MNYKTEQRNLLQNLFIGHPHEQFSAKEIKRIFNSENVSLSAIYRNLSALEEEGVLMRCYKSGSREAYYSYKQAENCREFIHLKCKNCGKTAHMPLEDTQNLTRNVLEHKKFIVDKAETVLYGVCELCQDKK